MRVLVVGAYPPAADRRARRTLETARRLLDRGDEVQVLSPHPSGADEDTVLVGLRGALALARRSRAFDALHVQADPTLFLHPATPRLQRILVGLGLAGALRLWRQTVAHLGTPADLAGGSGGRVARLIWGSFDRLVVDDQPAAEHLQAVLGIPAGRIEIASTQPTAETAPPAGLPEEAPAGAGETGGRSLPPGEALPPWRLEETSDAASIMEQVRARAAAERAQDLKSM